MQEIMNQRGITRFLLLFVIVGIILLPIAGQASDADKKTVRVGWYDSSFCYFDRFGRRCGIDYEYQQKISAYTGWNFEYVEGSWPALFQMLKDGEIDLLSDVSYSSERVDQMLFPDLPMGSESYYIYIDAENRAVTAENPASLNGKRIGVNKGSVQEGFLREWMNRNRVSIDIIPMLDEENEALEKVIRGELDGFASIYTFSSEQKVIPLCRIGSSDFYYAVNRNRPDLLAELNVALSGIQDEDPLFLDKLNAERLYSVRTHTYLTPEQEDWVRDHGSIRVGYREDYLPFCQTNWETGELTGALKDYLAFAENRLESTNIHFETFPFESTEKAIEALKAGEIDCVFPVYLSSYDADQMGLRLTNPVMNTEMNAVMPVSDLQRISKDNHLVIAAGKGDLNLDTFIMDRFPESSVLKYNSREEILSAVKSGKADCAILSNYRLSISEELFNRYKLFNVPIGESIPLSFAVNRDERECYFILNKAAVMSNADEMDAALASYVQSDRRVTLARFLRDNWLAVIILISVIFFIVIFLLVQKLKAEKISNERQRMMEEALRRELQQKEQLHAAMNMVYTDPLTGVKSKHAYNEAEERMDRRIEEKKVSKFGVVVFDLNDLKQINDKQGHKAGDEYIKTACRLICTHFKHSPVFRIGGDEFVAILEGEDFRNREEILEKFEKTILGNLEEEKIVIAFGSASFNPGQDQSIRAVFKRADAAMYKEKTLLKDIGHAHTEHSENEEEILDFEHKSTFNRRRSILIAEDMESNREILGDLLRSDYDIQYATDGKEAISILRSRKDEIALVLLDLYMPNMTGREVMMEMQVDVDLVNIPVIVLTVDHGAELDSLSIGAMDFIPKPYPQIEIIKARIDKCIELSEDRELLQQLQRNRLTGLYNPEYFLRYVGRYDRIYRDLACDAFVCDVEGFNELDRELGPKSAGILIRSIGISIRRLARKTGGIGCYGGEGTFMVYWPHRSDCEALIENFAENVILEKESNRLVRLRYGVFLNAQTEEDVSERFARAKAAAYSVSVDEGQICGVHEGNA